MKLQKRIEKEDLVVMSSNIRGFANCMSDLLEAVVCCEENSYEVISSEDLLHNAKKLNKEVEKMKSEMEEGMKRKDHCWKCKRWKRNTKKKQKPEALLQKI